MIRVKNLTKQFGRVTAIDNLSFEVERGEIVGFLGPNGAGKTTTMRILSCFMQPTGGTVTIAGLDVFSESREVRRKIGYLPENVPTYPEMRVSEYLSYRAGIKGEKGRRLRSRVD
jgi:ABC-2 type transport system ATP-binding protein